MATHTKHQCVGCLQAKEKGGFSEDQWAKSSGEGRCEECLSRTEEEPPRALTDMLSSLGLSSVTSGTGEQFFVSKNLQDRVTASEGGGITLKMGGDEPPKKKEAEKKPPPRGVCANPTCVSSTKATSRCSRCWTVDYCGRECQTADWKRHKISECTPKAKKEASSKPMGWQAHIYNARNSMKKHEYQPAIRSFRQAIKENPGADTSSLFIHLAECCLLVGDNDAALEYAYTACQADYGNPLTLCVKAKCHRARGEVQAAWMSVYSALQSQRLRFLEMMNEDKGINQKYIQPLHGEIFQECVHHLLEIKPSLNPHSGFHLPSQKIASVPCSVQMGPGGKNAMAVQLKNGTGWHKHKYQPKAGIEWQFEGLHCHTSVKSPDGESIIVFGGSNATGTSNNVWVLTLDPSNCYNLEFKRCRGDTPPPVQGHAACILGQSMYVFGGQTVPNEGGDGELDTMYVLDLIEWKWSKIPSEGASSSSSSEDGPENGTCFCSLTPIDNENILLVGGRRFKEVGNTEFGMAAYRGNLTSKNMHIWSARTQKWKRLKHNGDFPQCWGHSAHNVGPGKVVLFGGEDGVCVRNSIYLLDAGGNKNANWSKVVESLAGIPPSLSVFRSTAWMESEKRLLLFGGRMLQQDLSDAVWKMTDDDYDLRSSTLIYDSELFVFDLFATKQWTRLRVPEGCVGRNCHTLVDLHRKLIVFGGSTVPGGERGRRDERDYDLEVLRFDLDFSEWKVPNVSSSKAKKKKGKGKRK